LSHAALGGGCRATINPEFPISAGFITSLPVSIGNHTFRLVRLLSIDQESPDSVHIFIKANEAIANLQAKRSGLFSVPYDRFGQMLFEHLLQRAILERMAYTFSESWRLERIESADGGVWQPQPEPPSDGILIKAEDFPRYLRGNEFAELQLNLGALRQLALPPRTTLTTVPPSRFPGSRSAIRLENSFCSVAINISAGSAMAGLGPFSRFGQPGEWLPSSTVQLQGPGSAFDFQPVSGELGLVSYKISATASFSALLSGHPDMPAYRTWVNQMFTSLREQWDDDLLIKRTIERMRDERILGGSPAY
jgi:hypothetical protein